MIYPWMMVTGSSAHRIPHPVERVKERMVFLKNAEVRRAARARGIPLWKIAEKLGISEASMTRWLRVELSEERRSAIFRAIAALSREEG